MGLASKLAAQSQQPQQGFQQQQAPPQFQQQPPAQFQQQASPSAGGGLSRAPNPADFLRLLQNAVKENQLEVFYDSPKLERIANTIGPKLQNVASEWRIPMEIAVDLARLALYDIVLYADDSGSMKHDEGGERIEDLKVVLGRCAYIGGLFDDDGIEVRFMNSQIKGSNLTRPDQVVPMVSKVRFDGITPLGTELEARVIKPLVLEPAKHNRLKKPVLVITITDGEPTGEATRKVFKVITEAKQELMKTPYKANAVAFQFAQVGNDLYARKFLAKLDTDPEVGGMVDCTGNYEVESDEMSSKGVYLDPSTWIVKLLLGAIDPSYDSKDE